ncbi:hypothetical protein GN956_G24578 [Arapaima gigas]
MASSFSVLLRQENSYPSGQEPGQQSWQQVTAEFQRDTRQRSYLSDSQILRGGVTDQSGEPNNCWNARNLNLSAILGTCLRKKLDLGRMWRLRSMFFTNPTRLTT